MKVIAQSENIENLVDKDSIYVTAQNGRIPKNSFEYFV